ncbi:MAG: lipopolysaccharide transport periplasmic protein LptA [Steroidobacteraceae bacterium]
MANFKHNKSLHCRLSILMAAVMMPILTTQAASPKQINANIEVESDGAEVDARTRQLVLPKVRITQQGYAIQADEARATGLNFDNSQWTFNGKVYITTPDGFSTADRATVQFVQNQITEMHISGQPATFEQHDPGKQMLAQGHANHIDYDLQKNTVRLSQQAWVKYGQNEFTGATVVYDIINQRVLASREEQQGERVRITINPNAGNPATIPEPGTGSKP